MSSSNPNSLPGIVTDQPEIFESEPLSDDTGINDLDLINETNDEAIALIEVPIKQAFSYFAERENEIARFYVQRHGEYKIAGDKVEEETDIEKYHRLVSEVTELLNKFQADKESKQSKGDTCLSGSALTNNLEILSRQLKALEFAAEDGTLNPTQSEFTNIKSKLNKLLENVDKEPKDEPSVQGGATADDPSKLIRMSALEKRLNTLETLLGNNEVNTKTLLEATNCSNITDATDTLTSWLSLFKPESAQRVVRELDCLEKRMKEMSSQSGKSENTLDAQSKAKLDHLYNLVTATDKYRAIVPTIIHRLNTMEELQQKASQITTTLNHLEQIQARIVDSLQSNKVELSSLSNMFTKNVELIKEFSKDIDMRIANIRARDQ